MAQARHIFYDLEFNGAEVASLSCIKWSAFWNNNFNYAVRSLGVIKSCMRSTPFNLSLRRNKQIANRHVVPSRMHSLPTQRKRTQALKVFKLSTVILSVWILCCSSTGSMSGDCFGLTVLRCSVSRNLIYVQPLLLPRQLLLQVVLYFLAALSWIRSGFLFSFQSTCPWIGSLARICTDNWYFVWYLLGRCLGWVFAALLGVVRICCLLAAMLQKAMSWIFRWLVQSNPRNQETTQDRRKKQDSRLGQLEWGVLEFSNLACWSLTPGISQKFKRDDCLVFTAKQLQFRV